MKMWLLALALLAASRAHENDDTLDAILALDAHGKPPNEHLLLRPWRLADARAMRASSRRALTGVDVRLDVDAPSPLRDGDKATVHVANDGDRTVKDWLALYSPADARVNEVVPVKYVTLGALPGYADTGHVNVSFELVNMRESVRFVFFATDWQCAETSYPSDDDWWACSTGSADAVAMAESADLAFDEPAAPLHPRVIPADGGDALAVVWNGAAGSTGLLEWDVVGGGRPHARKLQTAGLPGDGSESPEDAALGEDDHEQYHDPTHSDDPYWAVPLNRLVVASTTTYTQDELCGAPANSWGWHDPGAIHTAKIFGAPRGATVRYRLRDRDTGAVSKTHSARLPPAAGADATLRLVTFGDLGRGAFDDATSWHEYGTAAKYTANALKVHETVWADAIYHIGDISYAVGISAIWDLYAHMMEPAISKVHARARA